MIYELSHSLDDQLPSVVINGPKSFPPHLHGNLEFITAIEGETYVEVDKKQYTVRPGTGVLVFPNQTHSFRTGKNNNYLIVIFSPQLVKAYTPLHSGKRPESNIFEYPTSLVKDLIALKTTDNILKVKGTVYSLCAEFDKSASYVEFLSENDSLDLKIFSFVENNYRKKCTLDILAENIFYNEAYLSRFFKRLTGITYTEYVSRYRINEATYLLKNTSKRILDIAFECGFDSLRSFNRNFKEITGMSPSEYREND